MIETGPKLTLIVARARNGVIGRNGDLPWRIKSEMAHFKAVTKGKPCLMGRKTWESLFVKPLPGRPCLVLTRDKGYEDERAEILHDFEAMIARGLALAAETGAGEAMVIGGAQLYRLALPRADRLYVTDIEAEIEGDAVFPEIDPDIWIETKKDRREAGPGDKYSYVVRAFARRA